MQATHTMSSTASLCDCNNPNALRAMWRDMKGKNVFTGIVSTDGETFYKLHDPTGPLDGDSHKMHVNEFLSKMAMHDGSSVPRAQKPIDKQLASMVDKRDVRAGVQVFGNPNDEPEPDEWFPFDVDDNGNLDVSKIRVRSDDSVQVKMVKRAGKRNKRIEHHERFWCHVISVTVASGGELARERRLRL